MNSQIRKIKTNGYNSPEALRRRNVHGLYPHIWAIGDLGILDKLLLGFFCSVKCPGEVILRVYDIAQALRDGDIGVISGFHSPLEKDCLDLLLRGTQPVVICPARGIQNMRMQSAWKNPLAEGRLLILAPFESKLRRLTTALTEQRNLFVAALSEQVFVAHAEPGGKTENFCRDILSWKRPIYTFDSDHNNNLIEMGAQPIAAENITGLATLLSA